MALPPANRAPVELELAIPAGALPALRRRMAGWLGRARPLHLAWHDGEDGALARAGLTVTEWHEGRAGGWRVDALAAPLGAVASPLAEAADPVLLAGLVPGVVLPAAPVPVLRLEGRARRGSGPDGVAAALLEGRLGTDGGATVAGHALVRLVLSGPPAAVERLALALAEAHGAMPALGPLVAEARQLAGMPVPPRALGAPHPPEQADAPGVFAHAVAHLMAVVLYHAPRAAAGVQGEPVHQMRVALRRLRSIAGLFRPVVGCREVEALHDAAKDLATLLGPARDWDVFLGGTGPAVAGAVAEEAALGPLLEGAGARRAAAYASLAAWLAGPGLARLAVMAAVLVRAQPWVVPGVPVPSRAAFAASVLGERRRRVVRKRADPAGLDDPALHALRLKAKRLRYAAEVFAPLYPGRAARRFLRRLAELQEELGLLNDGLVADQLMADLAECGGAGLAGGLVRGFVAGRAEGARGRIRRAWRELRHCPAFWD